MEYRENYKELTIQSENGGIFMKIIMKMRERINYHFTSEKHEENYRFELTRAFDTTSQKKGVCYHCDKWLYEDKAWKYYF